jgi:hypothetical protein
MPQAADLLCSIGYSNSIRINYSSSSSPGEEAAGISDSTSIN